MYANPRRKMRSRSEDAALRKGTRFRNQLMRYGAAFRVRFGLNCMISCFAPRG
jgi:hypothetical protein